MRSCLRRSRSSFLRSLSSPRVDVLSPPMGMGFIRSIRGLTLESLLSLRESFLRSYVVSCGSGGGGGFFGYFWWPPPGQGKNGGANTLGRPPDHHQHPHSKTQA